jgi:hypothetical protein
MFALLGAPKGRLKPSATATTRARSARIVITIEEAVGSGRGDNAQPAARSTLPRS